MKMGFRNPCALLSEPGRFGEWPHARRRLLSQGAHTLLRRWDGCDRLILALSGSGVKTAGDMIIETARNQIKIPSDAEFPGITGTDQAPDSWEA